MFAINIAGPFFNLYMIEHLKMNYLVINLCTTVVMGIGTVLFSRKWGALTDRYGNKPVTLVSTAIIAILPLLWLFATPSNYTIVFITNIISGIGYSAYNMALFNQQIWLAPARSRSAYAACYTLFTSVLGTAAAYVCGGLFMQYVGPVINKAAIPFIFGKHI